MHSLREFLFLAHRGKIRRKQEEEQAHRAMCPNLLTNVERRVQPRPRARSSDRPKRPRSAFATRDFRILVTLGP